MKRIIGLILVQAIVVVFLSLPVFAGTYKMRLHTLVKSPHPYNDMAEYFKKEVESESAGRISVKIFPGASLGKDPAIISDLKIGVVDLMISSTNNAEKQVPEFQVFSLGYLFPDFDSFSKVVLPDGPVQKYFEDVYSERNLGMKLLALGASGSRNLSNRQKPVNDLTDIQGFKMRTPPSPMVSKTWAALGTVPVTVAWSELYAGVQTGMVDALESSIPGYRGSKLYEVAPFLALTAHTIQANHISMSEKIFNKLPVDLQQLVKTVAGEAAIIGLEKAIEYEENFVKELQTKHGVTVTRPDTKGFVEVLTPVHDELAEERGLVEVLRLVRSTL